MRKIKKWHLWLVVGITFLIAVGLICLNLYVNASTIIIVFLVIDFLIMTFALNSAITMTFKFKPKPVKYETASFNFEPSAVMDHLLKSKFQEKKVSYGNTYLKIENDIAYKITIITSAHNYLHNENKTSNNTPNPKLKNCSKFIGCEIFLDYQAEDNKILKTIADFSFQGNNIYYEAFYFDNENNLLIEPNIIKINPDFEEFVTKLKKEYLLLERNV